MQAFFGDYLTTQRDLSPHTVLSYRDAFKLFLAFTARHRQKQVSELGFEDMEPGTVLAFLEDLEKNRGVSVRTRNARLSALHTQSRVSARISTERALKGPGKGTVKRAVRGRRQDSGDEAERSGIASRSATSKRPATSSCAS